jgi:Alpha/beta hydrolase domain
MPLNRAGVVIMLVAPMAAMAQERRPAVSTPTTITGPIASPVPPGDPSRNYPFFTTSDLAAKYDYIEEEYFVAGMASRYIRDGEVNATIAAEGPHPYRTRVLVRRPRSAERFNGIVILEWINVVPIRQWDFETDWNLTNEHLMRRGFVHVGASVGRLGIHAPTGLKAWNPARYGSLDLTAGGTLVNDELSVAIFTEIARALKHPSGTSLTGVLRVRNVIATGQSASSVQLQRYYNSIHPLEGVIDGFVIHGGGRPVRTDLRTPLFKLYAETDVIRNQAAFRQPDSDHLRTWEVAGASHLDVDVVRAHDRLMHRDLSPSTRSTGPDCGTLNPSNVPARLVQDAVYDWMKKWVEGAAQPPHGPQIEMTSIGTPGIGEAGMGVVKRDANGNALGGIRLAPFAVPMATNSGRNDGTGACFGFGSHIPFDPATVARLYPGRRSYVDAINRAADENLKAGFVTPEGAERMKRDAAALRWPGST